jgi:lambda repressor-like predicted transcriptional regulator
LHQHIELRAQKLQESRFKEDSLRSHFESSLDQLETELLTVRKNLFSATLDGLETAQPRKINNEILAAISRFFDSRAFPIILAFAGRPMRLKSTYQNLAMETERCFLTALKNSQSLGDTSATLYPFLNKVKWFKKHKSQIRETCRRYLLRWEARLFDPDGEPATSNAMDALYEGDETTCSTNTKARSSFVTPILEKKGWSVADWAKEAKVDYKTVHSYLKRATAPYPNTRKKLADALGVRVDLLPR